MGQFCLDEEIFNFEKFWNSATPRFTDCFVNTIPSCLLAALLLATAPFHVWSYIVRREAHLPKNTIKWSFNNAIRIVLLFTVIAVNYLRFTYDGLGFIFSWHVPSKARILSSFLNMLSFSFFAYILLLHRKHGLHTHWLPFAVTLLSAVLSLPFLYNQIVSWITGDYGEIILDYKTRIPLNTGFLAPIFDFVQSICLIVIFVQTCFAERRPQEAATGVSPSVATPLLEGKYPRPDMRRPDSPLDKCSFFSMITFSFVGKLLSKGYREVLTISDMWNLRKEDTNEQVNQRWEQIFAQNSSVFRTMIRSPLFYYSFILRIFYDALKFVKPQLLKLFLGLFTSGTVHPQWNGYVLAGGFFFASILQSIFLNNYFMLLFILSNRIQSALTSTIYRRSIRLSNEERTKHNSGNIYNLVAVDAYRLARFMPDFHLIWSCPLQVIVSLAFLYIELGPAIFAGVAVLVLLIPANIVISKYQQRIEKEQMEKKDQRLKTINEVLSGIKVIKLYGWELPFMDKISRIRAEEIDRLRRIAYSAAVNSFMWSCAPIAVSFTAFAVYVIGDSNNVLTVEKAFVSLALFEGLRFPMAEMASVVTTFYTRMISIRRLDDFFNNTKEIDDYVYREKIGSGRISLRISNGKFAWKNDHRPELRNINLQVRRGTIVAIVGNVAMGKSSLLNAILGNMKLVSGRVSIDPQEKIAYVAQQAWIQNATARDNILFGKKFNGKEYRKIVNICQLKDDFKTLQAGDLTEIGEKGINLSGGQKQRIAMARACYSDSNLFLFDDPLSAVDSHVGKRIFDQVLSSKTGYLKDCTRVLVTNNIQFLPEVDEVIVLSNGKIKYSGKYRDLLENEADFAEFIQEYSRNVSKNSEDHHDEPEAAVLEAPSGQMRVRTFSMESENEMQPDIDPGRLIEEEGIEIGRVKWKIYFKYFQAFTYVWTIGLIFGYFMMQAAQLGTEVWLVHWSQGSITNSTDGQHSQMFYLQVYGLIGFVQMLFSVLSLISLVIGGMKAASTFHVSLLWGVMRSPMEFFDTTPLGRILNRFSKDIEAIDSEITEYFEGYIFCLVKFISSVLVVLYKLPIFIIFVVPLLTIYHFISRYFVTTSRQLRRLESISKSPIFSHITETLAGISTIRAYGVQKRFLDEVSRRIDNNIRCIFPGPMLNRWLSLRLELLGSSILLFVTILIMFYRDRFASVPGLIGLLVTSSLYVTDNLNWMSRMAADIETNIVCVERIQEYSDNPPEGAWSREDNTDPELEENWPQGEIEFVNYSLRYRQGLDLVIKDLNIQINSGEKIGIVGRTGAGKSSLTLALFRIIEAASGSIFVDGVDIAKIGLHELRSKLSIIPQDPILFSGTIRSNLDPFSSYTDETIWRALENSHLKDFVFAQREGLQYVVAENGENLSVGQRQLICLGRALLRHTKILVLDEATASVDLETDALIQDTIRTEFVGCTILTIAHRLNTILDYDRVIVLDHGELVEFDSPENLLMDRGSIFYSLASDARLV